MKIHGNTKNEWNNPILFEISQMFRGWCIQWAMAVIWTVAASAKNHQETSKHIFDSIEHFHKNHRHYRTEYAYIESLFGVISSSFSVIYVWKSFMLSIEWTKQKKTHIDTLGITTITQFIAMIGFACGCHHQHHHRINISNLLSFNRDCQFNRLFFTIIFVFDSLSGQFCRFFFDQIIQIYTQLTRSQSSAIYKSCT